MLVFSRTQTRSNTLQSRALAAFNFVGLSRLSSAEQDTELQHAQFVDGEATDTIAPFADTHLGTLAEGSYDLWLYAGQYPVGLRDLSINKDFSISSQLTNVLSLDCILSGGSALEVPGKSRAHGDFSRIYLSAHGAQGRQTRSYKKGERIRGVGLWLSPELLVDRFGLDTQRSPTPVRSVLALQKQDTVALPLTASIGSILTDILGMPFQGIRAEQFLDAKISELLCYFVELLQAPQAAYGGDNHLPRRKANALNEVIQIVNNNLAQPPDLPALARQTGLSRSALAELFKSSLGLSISQYLLQQRMVAAKELLQSGKLSILEVALSVGYADQSAFGRAYKRFHQRTPREDKGLL